MNQYRCETCKFKDYDIEHICTYKGSTVMTDRTIRFIAVRGCASHSDFQSEREMVLDELCKTCQFCDDRFDEYCGNCVVESARVKSRQVKE